MSSRLKTMLVILASLLVLYYGLNLTNQSRLQQGARIQSNQSSVEKRDEDAISGTLGNAKKADKEYKTDILKKSLGGGQ